MTRAKKDWEIVVRIRTPEDLTIAQIGREIKTLINDQCNWLGKLEAGDIRAVRVTSMKRIPKT